MPTISSRPVTTGICPNPDGLYYADGTYGGAPTAQGKPPAQKSRWHASTYADEGCRDWLAVGISGAVPIVSVGITGAESKLVFLLFTTSDNSTVVTLVRHSPIALASFLHYLFLFLLSLFLLFCLLFLFIPFSFPFLFLFFLFIVILHLRTRVAMITCSPVF